MVQYCTTTCHSDGSQVGLGYTLSMQTHWQTVFIISNIFVVWHCACPASSGSLVPKQTYINSLVRRGLAWFKSFLGCDELAVLKSGKPIRLLESRKSQDLSHVECYMKARALSPSLFIVSQERDLSRDYLTHARNLF